MQNIYYHQDAVFTFKPALKDCLSSYSKFFSFLVIVNCLQMLCFAYTSLEKYLYFVLITSK